MNKGLFILTLLAGAAVGYWFADKTGSGVMAVDAGAKGEKNILYWVAPMDANFRRDEPGLSPMGMDLVPVYEAGSGTSDEQDPGVITINANVENNIGVRVAAVSYAPLPQQMDAVGYVDFDQDKLWHIHPRVEGWVESLAVSAQGDAVTEGMVLFSVYSPTLVSAQEEYLTALNRGSGQIIESSKNRLLALGISLSQIKRLEKNRKASQLIAIHARFDGYITALNVREGQFIRPSDKVMSVGSIDSVWVVIEAFERQQDWLKHGLATTMTLAHDPGRQWQGKIAHIHPFLNPESRTIRMRLHFDNPDEALKPNMFVKVNIHSDNSARVIAIPREALIRTGKQDRVVLSLGKGRYRSVAVIPGRESGGMIEIVRGLQRDEQVVISAHFLLDSESSVAADFSRLTPVERVDHHEDNSR